MYLLEELWKRERAFSTQRLKQKAGAGDFVTEWRFAELGEKEFMACMKTDMEAMGAFMSSPEELQWDKDNDCEYTVYGMEVGLNPRTLILSISEPKWDVSNWQQLQLFFCL